jgi:hypothetical protein
MKSSIFDKRYSLTMIFSRLLVVVGGFAAIAGDWRAIPCILAGLILMLLFDDHTTSPSETVAAPTPDTEPAIPLPIEWEDAFKKPIPPTPIIWRPGR